MSVAGSAPRTLHALEGARDAFLRDVEERRLRLFRSCLQASLRSASTLAFSFAEHVGLTLDDILQVMTPPPFWPQSTGALTLPQVRWSLPSPNVWRGGGDDRMMWRVARGGGHAMRVGGGGDWIGWRVSGDTVDVAGRLGSGVLVTSRGTMRLWIRQDLPATVCAAMPGRPLGSVVHHPFLVHEGLKVVSVDDHGGGGHVIRCRTGRRALSPPWPGQLAGVLVAHSMPSLAAVYAGQA